MRRAFTLVEMLVVIAIFLLLMSLLMPSLRGAWSRAREIHCINQLRQVGVLCVLYSKDHQGALPQGVPVNPATLWKDTAQKLTEYMRSLTVPSNVWYCPALGPGVWSSEVYKEPQVTPAEWMTTASRPILAEREFRIGYVYLGGMTGKDCKKFRKEFDATRLNGRNQELVFDYCASWEAAPESAADVPAERWNDFPHGSPQDPRVQNRLMMGGYVDRREKDTLTKGYVYDHPRRAYW
jgi:prepilin-type N-terminal cleavage/methylation domain-containing protein